MRKITRASAVIIVLCMIHMIGAASDDVPVPGYPRTIVDTAGRTVTIIEPIERIIVLNPDAAEAVVMLGAGERIVGITKEIFDRSIHLPGIEGIQVVGTKQIGGDIDYELIGDIACGGNHGASDMLVIGFSGVGKGYGASEVEKIVHQFGVSNVGLDFYQPENLSREITSLGALLDREDAASDYLDWHQERWEEIETSVAGLSANRTYLEEN